MRLSHSMLPNGPAAQSPGDRSRRRRPAGGHYGEVCRYEGKGRANHRQAGEICRGPQ